MHFFKVCLLPQRYYQNRKNEPKSENMISKESTLWFLIFISGPRRHPDMFLYLLKSSKNFFEMKKIKIGFAHAVETCLWVKILTPIMSLLVHTTSDLPILPQNPLKIQGNWGRTKFFFKNRKKWCWRCQKHFLKCLRVF